MSIRKPPFQLNATGTPQTEGPHEAKRRLGRVISHRRKTLGMAQRRLAAALDKPPATVSAWELGKVYPDLISVVAVARVFRTTVSALLSEAGIETSQSLDSPALEPTGVYDPRRRPLAAIEPKASGATRAWR
jgi:transcriptional regulator with XRE-family HTH domain